MNMLSNLFRQKYDTLSNGTRVEEGDIITFVNSDGVKCTDKIKRRKSDGRLYFWNPLFKISDYKSATKED